MWWPISEQTIYGTARVTTALRLVLTLRPQCRDLSIYGSPTLFATLAHPPCCFGVVIGPHGVATVVVTNLVT